MWYINQSKEAKHIFLQLVRLLLTLIMTTNWGTVCSSISCSYTLLPPTSHYCTGLTSHCKKKKKAFSWVIYIIYTPAFMDNFGVVCLYGLRNTNISYVKLGYDVYHLYITTLHAGQLWTWLELLPISKRILPPVHALYMLTLCIINDLLLLLLQPAPIGSWDEITWWGKGRQISHEWETRGGSDRRRDTLAPLSLPL